MFTEDRFENFRIRKKIAGTKLSGYVWRGLQLGADERTASIRTGEDDLPFVSKNSGSACCAGAFHILAHCFAVVVLTTT